MRKITIIHYFLFMLVLILLLYLFKTGIPQLPLAENKTDLTDSFELNKETLTVLLCDPTASRGSPLIILVLHSDHSLKALYLSESFQINGVPISEALLAGPANVLQELQPLFRVTYYLTVNMAELDRLLDKKQDSLSTLVEKPSHSSAVNLLKYSGELFSDLWQVASEAETNMKSTLLMQLAYRLNGLRPTDVTLYEVNSSCDLTRIYEQIQGG